MKTVLRLNAIRVVFLLGVSLIAAGIIYFFAANWGGLPRLQKISLAAGLIVIFYGASYLFSRLKTLPGHHAFLSDILLVASCISFGAAVALLGQIYNWHADSYTLFLAWSVPALLFARIGRYGPFYVLSYVLLHAALWFYFYPSSLGTTYTEIERLAIGGLFASINFIAFLLAEYKRLPSAAVKTLSFLVFYLFLLLMTNSFEYETYGVWINLLYIVAAIFCFYYFIRIRRNKTFLTLNALAVSVFAVFKFIELASRFGSTGFYVLGLCFVALLLTGNVLFFRYVNRLDDESSPSLHMDDFEERPERETSRNGRMLREVVSTIVTIVGVLIGSISLIGLVMFAAGSSEPQYALFIIALVLIAPMLALNEWNEAVRYTLLTVGFIAGIVSTVWIHMAVLSVVMLLLSIAGWLALKGRIQRLLTYAVTNLNIGIVLVQLFEWADPQFAYFILTLAVINSAIFVPLHRKADRPFSRHLRESSLFFTLLYLFWLTFLDGIFPYSYEIFNAVNFIVVTSLIFVFLRMKKSSDAGVAFVFWFVYVAFKYYDMLWPLLHKSVTLIVAGVLLFSAVYIIARKAGSGDEERPGLAIVRKSSLAIFAVIVLQLAYLGVQAVNSEILLTNGVSVKLELQPVDPRSLLQGDYVSLNYDISVLPHSVSDSPNPYSLARSVKVVLAPDQSGVYRFDRMLAPGESIAEKEVVINGKLLGGQRVYYGIETYFVPEGAGLEVERSARFAYIRVGASGDALLERLAEN
ncbi:GDYXXLXY domain-containing protein [Paenibacillus thermotolerans]|uniref:GDYXXLXY domain-containing protein n=1 Tax=Paenibacillus thermotolerans TaxID=3027807 RepID=UPI002367E8A5|nr:MULTISPECIES: GDYXXLXY domain-containing protein [unclassified Paenibacillus]